VTLKLRYADFTTITRSRSVTRALRDAESIYGLARDLLIGSTEARVRPVRLIGVSASNFIGDDEPEQLWLPL
jgi:DNA polymerase-4